MSSSPNYNPFHGIDKLTQTNLIDSLEENIKSYLDWGLLNIGGFINIDIPTTGLYGGNFHQLSTTDIPGYKLGQVWQSHKKDWVWESGFYYNDGELENHSPNQISGVYINNQYVPGPTGVANTGYYINYPLGQIVFNKALPRNAKVTLNYAYKWCQVYKSSTNNYWKELQKLSYSPTPQINQNNKGEYNVLAEHRLQMPCIIVEPIARSSSRGHQLGSYTLRIDQDIMLHIFTENQSDKNRLADLIRRQEGSSLNLYDVDKVVNSGVAPLNYNGSINSSGLMDYQLRSDYGWYQTYFKNIDLLDMETLNNQIYWCTLRITSETIL